jgi:hypothetical protein
VVLEPFWQWCLIRLLVHHLHSPVFLSVSMI